MNALMYIVRKSVKNSLKELLRKPAKLIMYLLVVAAIIGVIVISIFAQTHVQTTAPMFWFTAILFAYIALFVIINTVSGLSSGNAIFEMNDVNLLFVSPISPQKILLYGVVRMAKTAFLAGFFILFQASSLANFGVNFGGVLLTFAGFMLSMVVLTIASLLIYSVTNGNERRRRIVKCLVAAIFLPFVIYLVREYAASRDIVASLKAALESPFLRFIPVAGWTAAGVTAFIAGSAPVGALFFGLNLLLGTGMMAYILLSNPDYYEDVLVATETAYEKKRAAAEGNIGAASMSKKRVKVSKTGIPGIGASALFGKHMRESFRQNRFGIFSISSALIVVGAVIAVYFIRDMLIAMQILMWMQIFLIGTGRGLKETYLHYIYLIPEPSFGKILWSNMEIMARTLIESVLMFGIGGALIGASALYILICIVTYTLFSLVLIGVNYLSMRFTGADISAGILIMLYFLAVILIMAPGIVAAIVIGIAIGGSAGFLTGLLVLSGWELAVGVVCLGLSRGVLHDCDMAELKTGK